MPDQSVPKVLKRYPMSCIGRDLDALVAQHVLGWGTELGPYWEENGERKREPILMPPDGLPEGFTYPPKGRIAFCYHAPPCSTYDDAAYRLVRRCGLYICAGHKRWPDVVWDETWYVGELSRDFPNGQFAGRHGVFAATIPLAVCIAALESVGFQHDLPGEPIQGSS